MTGPVCPSCGVAVVPGYVRCPKCHKPLPRRQSTVVEGGTAVESSRKLPMVAIIGLAVVGAGIIAYIGLRSSARSAKAAPVATPTEQPVQPDQADTQATGGRIDTPTPTTTQVARPDPGAAADALERKLKRQRLWSTVTFEGNRVDVRSGSCSDPTIRPVLDGAAASLKAAGLTKLRCLEQSGAVVTDRDL
jgi:hypothetical protein